MEIWRTVVGHVEYEVSNHGRVRKAMTSERGYRKGKMLKPYTTGKTADWYPHVKLNSKPYAVHRLVLTTFVCRCPRGMEANHKDGRKTNNHVSNLEWVTPSENVKHAHKLGLKNMKGEKGPSSKLKDGEVWLIRKLLPTYLTQRYIAKMFKVHESTITSIKKGHTWT